MGGEAYPDSIAETSQYFLRSVRRSIIHHDDLLFRPCLRKRAFHRRLDPAGAVEAGDADGDERAHGLAMAMLRVLVASSLDWMKSEYCFLSMGRLISRLRWELSIIAFASSTVLRPSSAGVTSVALPAVAAMKFS